MTCFFSVLLFFSHVKKMGGGPAVGGGGTAEGGGGVNLGMRLDSHEGGIQ